MSLLRTLLVLVSVFVVQVAVFSFIQPFGISPNLLVLSGIAGAIVGGGDFGARHGFAAGLLFDLVTPTPFGLAAGVFGAVAYGVGLFMAAFDSEDPRVVPIVAGIASFLGIVGFGLGLGVLGAEQHVNWGLLWIASVVSLWNVVLALPILSAYRWCISDRVYARSEPARSVVN